MISTLERLRSSRAALEHRLAPPAPAPPPRPPRWPPRASAPDAKATADKRSTLTTKYRDRLFMSYLLSVAPHPGFWMRSARAALPALEASVTSTAVASARLNRAGLAPHAHGSAIETIIRVASSSTIGS